MSLKMIILVTCVAIVATSALAHKGATGMLLERMNGMLAMGKETKEISPMMRGQQDYDAARTTAYAAVLKTHSGEAMLNLFLEGMNMKPSVAKDGSYGPMRDTHLVGGRMNAEIAFVASNPGKWLYHCHMLSHQDAGMKTWMNVRA